MSIPLTGDLVDLPKRVWYNPHMKTAVIGIGKLGSIHLRIWRELAGISQVYAVDNDPAKLADLEGVERLSDYRELAGKVDLVSVASPTTFHYAIAAFFLKNKIPVLVEKPITQDLAQADRLIKLAQKNKTLLAVGHVERYNSAYMAVKANIKDPLFIECHRLSPYPARSLDISVVSDLMIHDLDIMLDLVKDKVKKIEVKGVPVLSPTADIANVRITFVKGCVANITASRISAKKERKFRIFMRDCYISLDYANQSVEIYRKVNNQITKLDLPINKEEPLKQEIRDFISLVKAGNQTLEHAVKARNALALALKIEKKI